MVPVASRSRDLSFRADARPPHRQVKGSHARFHSSPRHPGHRRHDRGRDHLVLDVPLRGRSGQPDRLAGYAGRRTRGRAQVARARRSGGAAVRPLFRQRGAVQIRRLLSISPAGLESADGADAGDAGTRRLRHRFRDGVRHPDGGLFGAETRHVSGQGIPGGVADRNFAADLPDRHSADLSVRGGAGLAAVVRPRRGGAAGLVDHRPADDFRPQGPDHAFGHARPVPDDA